CTLRHHCAPGLRNVFSRKPLGPFALVEDRTSNCFSVKYRLKNVSLLAKSLNLVPTKSISKLSREVFFEVETFNLRGRPFTKLVSEFSNGLDQGLNLLCFGLNHVGKMFSAPSLRCFSTLNC